MFQSNKTANFNHNNTNTSPTNIVQCTLNLTKKPVFFHWKKTWTFVFSTKETPYVCIQMQLTNRKHLTRTDIFQICNTRTLQRLIKRTLTIVTIHDSIWKWVNHVDISRTLNISYSVTLFKNQNNFNYYKDILILENEIDISTYLFVTKYMWKENF